MDDVEIESVRTPTPPSTIFSIVPFPKQRDDVGEFTCDHFTFLNPVDLVEKENDSVDEVQTSDNKVHNTTPLMKSKSTKSHKCFISYIWRVL